MIFRIVDYIRALLGEIRDVIRNNPGATLLFALLVYAAYEYREARMELQTVCDLTGDHNHWTVYAATAHDKINDICLGQDPDTREQPGAEP